MARVFNKPSYIDRNLIFSNPYDRSQTLNLSNNPEMFYGYRIDVSNRKNLAFVITNVRIEAAYADGEIEIVLLHSSQSEPIKTKTITLDNNGVLHIERLDWYIDNSDQYYKGVFFIGYNVPGTSFTPYERQYNDANVMNNISELCIQRIKNLGTFDNFDTIQYIGEHNGLNFDITVYEDYTDLILQNKFIFSRAIQLQWAMSVMLMCISSNRSNRNERISKEMLSVLMLTIEGQIGFGLQKVTGLRDTLAGELARLGSEIESIVDGYFDGMITVSTTT